MWHISLDKGAAILSFLFSEIWTIWLDKLMFLAPNDRVVGT